MDTISMIALSVGCAVLLLVIIIFACRCGATKTTQKQDALDREALLEGSRLIKKGSKTGDVIARKKSVTFRKQEYPDESQELQEQSQDTSLDTHSSFPGQYQESSGSHSFSTVQQNESNQSDFSHVKVPEARGYNMEGSSRSSDANSRQNLQKQTYIDDDYQKRRLNSGMTVKQIVEKVKNGSDKNMHDESCDTSELFYDNNTNTESGLCHDCYRYRDVDEQIVTDEGTSDISSSIGYNSSGQIQNGLIKESNPTPCQEKHLYELISKQGLSGVNRDKFAAWQKAKIAIRSASKLSECTRRKIPTRYSCRRGSFKEHLESCLSSAPVSKQLSRSQQQFVPVSSTPITHQMCQHPPKLIPTKQSTVVVPPPPSKLPLVKPQQSSNANALYQQSTYKQSPIVVTRNPPKLPSTKLRCSTMAGGPSVLPSTPESSFNKARPHSESLLAKQSKLSMARPQIASLPTKQSSAAVTHYQSELLPTNRSSSISKARLISESLARKQPPIAMVNPPSVLTPKKQTANVMLEVPATKQSPIIININPPKLPPTKLYSSSREFPELKQPTVATGMPIPVAPPLPLAKATSIPSTKASMLPVPLQPPTLHPIISTLISVPSPPLPPKTTPVVLASSPQLLLPPAKAPLIPEASSQPPLYPTKGPELIPRKQPLIMTANPPSELSQTKQAPNLKFRTVLEVRATKQPSVPMIKTLPEFPVPMTTIPPEFPQTKQYSSPSAVFPQELNETKQSSIAAGMSISVAPKLLSLPVANETLMSLVSPPQPLTKGSVLPVPSPPPALPPAISPVMPVTSPPLPPTKTPVVVAPPPQLLLPPREAPIIPVASSQPQLSPTKAPVLFRRTEPSIAMVNPPSVFTPTPNVMPRTLLEVPATKDSFISMAKPPPELPQTKHYSSALASPETKQSSNVAPPLSPLPLTNTTFMSQISPPLPSTKALVVPVPSPPSPVRTKPVVLAPSPKVLLTPTKVPFIPVASWQPPSSPIQEPVILMTKTASLTPKLSQIIAKFEMLATEKKSKDDLAQVVRNHSVRSPVYLAQVVRKDSVRSPVDLAQVVRKDLVRSPVDPAQVVRNHSVRSPVDPAQVVRNQLVRSPVDLVRKDSVRSPVDLVRNHSDGCPVRRAQIAQNRSVGSQVDIAQVARNHSEGSAVDLAQVARHHLDGREESKIVPDLEKQDIHAKERDYENSKIVISGNRGQALLRNTISDFASDIDFAPITASTPQQSTAVLRNSIPELTLDIDFQLFTASTPQQSTAVLRNSISELASDIDFQPFTASTPQHSTAVLRNSIPELASDIDFQPFTASTPQHSTSVLRNSIPELASDIDFQPFTASTPQESTDVLWKAELETKEIVHSNRSILHSHLKQRRLQIKDSTLDASGFAATEADSFWDDSISPIKKSLSVDEMILNQEKKKNSVSDDDDNDFALDKTMTNIKSMSSTTIQSTSFRLFGNLEDKMASVKNIRDDPAVRALLADIKARRNSSSS